MSGIVSSSSRAGLILASVGSHSSMSVPVTVILVFSVVLVVHALSLVEEVLSVLHEVDLLQKQVCLLVAEAFGFEHVSGCLLQLVVGSFNLSDVNELFL